MAKEKKLPFSIKAYNNLTFFGLGMRFHNFSRVKIISVDERALDIKGCQVPYKETTGELPANLPKGVLGVREQMEFTQPEGALQPLPETLTSPYRG